MALWTMVVLASLWHSLTLLEQHTWNQAQERARSVFRIILLTRSWVSSHVGVYVPITERTPPNPYLVMPHRDVVTTDGQRLTRINPAYMTRQLSEMARDQGLRFHITSELPLNPNNTPDDWEREALLSFSRGVSEFFDLTFPSGPGQRTEFRYMAPLLVERTCLACHGHQGYAVGDVRGGISVSFDAVEVQKALDHERLVFAIKHFLVWLLVSLLAGYSLHRMRIYWRNMRSIQQRQDELIAERTLQIKQVNTALEQEVARREEAQQRLDRERHFLQSVIDGIQDPLIVVASDRRLLLHNRQAVETFGLERFDDLAALTCRQLIPDGEECCQMAHHGCPLTRVQTQSGSLRTLYTHFDPQGGVRYSELLVAPLYLVPGECTGAIISAHDITRRLQGDKALRMERDRAERASAAKSNFVAMVSHEIRTPMNAIIGMGELLMESKPSQSQIFLIRTIQQSSDALLALINEILDLAKMESNELVLMPETFDLRDLLSGVEALMTPVILERGVAFAVQLDPALPTYWRGDFRRIRQVLLNLIGNAHKFTTQGEIRLEVAQDPEDASGNRLLFRVQDSGIGIPEEQLESIFEPFAQVHATGETKTSSAGTGLGLTICRRLVALMGGRLWVTSQVGQGSCFCFNPLLQRLENETGVAQGTRDAVSGVYRPVDVFSPAADPTEGRTAGVAKGDWQQRRILLAEDSADNVFLIQAYLKQTGAELVVAHHGAQAVSLFQESGPFDAVLMDIQMPVLDGLEATRRIRAHEMAHLMPRTPVAALTAHAMPEEQERSRDAGCDLHLSKPIKKVALIEALKRLFLRQ
ncbi:MAG: ATP-binding protein [Magnetococcus sp. WYHC-3]